jgi:hypothetical protein
VRRISGISRFLYFSQFFLFFEFPGAGARHARRAVKTAPPRPLPPAPMCSSAPSPAVFDATSLARAWALSDDIHTAHVLPPTPPTSLAPDSR